MDHQVNPGYKAQISGRFLLAVLRGAGFLVPAPISWCGGVLYLVLANGWS